MVGGKRSLIVYFSWKWVYQVRDVPEELDEEGDNYVILRSKIFSEIYFLPCEQHHTFLYPLNHGEHSTRLIQFTN